VSGNGLAGLLVSRVFRDMAGRHVLADLAAGDYQVRLETPQ
jgi:hypothetical protein